MLEFSLYLSSSGFSVGVLCFKGYYSEDAHLPLRLVLNSGDRRNQVQEKQR